LFYKKKKKKPHFHGTRSRCPQNVIGRLPFWMTTKIPLRQ